MQLITKTKHCSMKHLKLKKIKIATINNLKITLGGNTNNAQGCVPDSYNCPHKKTEDPYNVTCQTTNNDTLTGNVTGSPVGISLRCKI